jgi:nitrile hydratase accessory protein
MSISDLIRDEPSLPRRNGELVFDAPWQSRAFSVAVALAESGVWDWDAFRTRLIDEIGAWTGAGGDAPEGDWDYYAHWLAALERVLLESRVLTAAELDAEQRRLAHEAAHEHDDEHGHGHGHGHAAV